VNRDYTIKEAAEFLGVKPNSVRAAILRGKLLAWKRGNLYLIDGMELRRWNAHRRVGRPVKNG